MSTRVYFCEGCNQRTQDVKICLLCESEVNKDARFINLINPFYCSNCQEFHELTHASVDIS